MSVKKPFNEQALFITQTGSLTATFAILCLAIRINLAAVQFGLMTLVGGRIVVTFLLLQLIWNDVEGFELIDPKTMNDSI